MTNDKRTYLGDGLYAEYDGFAYTLVAPRDDGDHWVYLEPQVLAAFFRYIEQKDGVQITVKDVPK